MIGIFLILLGALMLLDQLGWIDIRVGQYLLPIFLVALGVHMVMRTSRDNQQGPPARH
jgi:hypothetical protein